MVLSLLWQQGGILFAREREATGCLCIDVMYVLRNAQAFKEVQASPFHCWDTDVLLVKILLSAGTSFLLTPPLVLMCTQGWHLKGS